MGVRELLPFNINPCYLYYFYYVTEVALIWDRVQINADMSDPFWLFGLTFLCSG